LWPSIGVKSGDGHFKFYFLVKASCSVIILSRSSAIGQTCHSMVDS
jgi:hypothetical protein